jgi:peptidyl-prolyl cis-trans isomerase C
VPLPGLLVNSKGAVFRRSPPWRRCLRSPLLYALLVVAAIGAFGRMPRALNTGQGEMSRIELTDEDCRRLAAGTGQWNRPPTWQELKGLIDQRVREEILYRQALDLGLDQGDEVIRQRLAQKMEALLDSRTADVQWASPQELRDWFSANADRFRTSERITFRQLFFSPQQRGPHAPADAALALAQLASQEADWPGAAALADTSVLQDRYRDCSSQEVNEVFGAKFCRRLFALKSGCWQGPIESALGWHLVLVESTQPSRLPAFEEIRADVGRAWAAEKRAGAKAAWFDAMKARYVIVLPKAPLSLDDPNAVPSAGSSTAG